MPQNHAICAVEIATTLDNTKVCGNYFPQSNQNQKIEDDERLFVKATPRTVMTPTNLVGNIRPSYSVGFNSFLLYTAKREQDSSCNIPIGLLTSYQREKIHSAPFFFFSFHAKAQGLQYSGGVTLARGLSIGPHALFSAFDFKDDLIRLHSIVLTMHYSIVLTFTTIIILIRCYIVVLVVIVVVVVALTSMLWFHQ